MEAEFKEQITEEMEEQYRFPISIQIFIQFLVALASISILYLVNTTLIVKVSAFICILAVTFPVFIHVRNQITQTIAFALFGGAFTSIILLSVNFLIVESFGGGLLTLAFLGIIGVELLHHTTKVFRVQKTTGIYIFDAILAVAFFIDMFLFFWEGVFNGPFPLIPSFLITCILTLIFFYAILPEQEF